ncbi:hypothetical protein ACX9I7_23215, partial [Streptomyces sp. L500]
MNPRTTSPGARRPDRRGPTVTTMPFGAPTAVRSSTAVAARATDLTKVYGQGETQVVALDAVSVDFR